jgi:hypothetical protein
MLTISVIKIGVQGPAGPAGATGAPGSNANVTAATVLTAAQAMDATQEAGMRAAIAAQSAVESFADRFDDSTRYANGATITHLATTPKVGEAWRLSTGAAIPPAVTVPPVAASSFQGNAAGDTLTIAAGHTFLTGFPVRVSGAGLPAPLVATTTYYAIRISGTVIKLATSTANALAGTAINLTTDGSAAQQVAAFGMARGLTPSDGNGLFYLGSAMQTANGKFALAFEFTPVLTDQPAGAADLGLNISFANTTMITDGAGIDPDDVVHINIGSNGVVTCDFYDAVSSVAIPPTSTAPTSGVHLWNSRGTRWATGRKQVLIIVVDGDYLRVISPGHGAVEFYHANLSTKVSATTNFWWEPSGSVAPGVSQFYKRKLVLHRVTDSLEQVQLEQWGQEETSGLSGDGQSVIATRLRVMSDAAAEWATGNDPTAGDNYAVATPRKMRADLGFWTRVWSGYADYTAPLTQNLVTAELSSGAGASNTNLLSLFDAPLVNVGDWNECEVMGTFAANGNTKGVQIFIATAGAAAADTGAIAPNGGTFRAYFRRVRLTGASHTIYGEIRVTSGGTTTFYTGSYSNNSGTSAFALQLRVTGVAAGDVKIQHGVWRSEVRS